MTRCIAAASNRSPDVVRAVRHTSIAQLATRGLFIAAMLAATAAPSFAADVARGRALYENHCEYCHTPKIHVRANRLPATRDEVRLIVDDWRRQVNLGWTPEEVEDVVEYLNVTRYKFVPK